jgi:hypothetical protein
MSKGKAFNSAKLQPDGTVEVTGPFSLDPGEPKAPALLSFYLVQDSKTVEGDGRWLVGTPEWTGTGGSGLKAGTRTGHRARRPCTQRATRVHDVELVPAG